jgi:hypothetical protein
MILYSARYARRKPRCVTVRSSNSSVSVLNISVTSFVVVSRCRRYRAYVLS